MGRSIASAIMLLLAFGAVFSDPLGSGYPTGALLLICAALTWFHWDTISEGFRSAKDESNVPIVRQNNRRHGIFATWLASTPFKLGVQLLACNDTR
jgi:hypothetical protein